MKHQIQFALVIMICLACTNCICANKGLKGSGHVIKEIRQAKSFNQINIDGIFNIYLSQGEKEAIEVEADDNLLEYVKTDINNSVLSIDFTYSKGIEKSTELNIYITVTDINQLELEGIGNVSCLTDLHLNKLKLINSGIGSINLKGKASEVYIKNSGIGKIKATEFEVAYLKVKASGVGSVRVNATKEISVNLSGVGNVYYTGEPKLKDINMSGIGKFRQIK
jgi:hypothetical protein